MSCTARKATKKDALRHCLSVYIKIPGPKGDCTYISRTHNPANLLHRIQIRAETSVHGEDLLVDNGGNGQAVEAVCECFPQLDVVSTLAFVVESVDTVNRCALMVATENEKVFRVLDLVRQQQANGLKRLFATVDIISEEQIVCFGGETAVLEETQEVVVLAVNITANLSPRPSQPE